MIRAFPGLKLTSPKAKDCVRYVPKLRRYELVVDGEVTATISKFAYSVPGARRKFDAKVREAAAAKRIEALVERLYPDARPAPDAA